MEFPTGARVLEKVEDGIAEIRVLGLAVGAAGRGDGLSYMTLSQRAAKLAAIPERFLQAELRPAATRRRETVYFEISETILVCTEAVWVAVKDWSCARRWMRGVERSLLLDQRFGEGARRGVQEGGDDREVRIVAWESEKRLVLRARNDGLIVG